MHVEDDMFASGERPAPKERPPGQAQLNLAMQCGGAAVVCVLMAIGIYRIGDSFAIGLDALMSSANYWRVVLALACLGWLVAAAALWALSGLWWRAGERAMGIAPKVRP